MNVPVNKQAHTGYYPVREWMVFCTIRKSQLSLGGRCCGIVLSPSFKSSSAMNSWLGIQTTNCTTGVLPFLRGHLLCAHISIDRSLLNAAHPPALLLPHVKPLPPHPLAIAFGYGSPEGCSKRKELEPHSGASLAVSWNRATRYV